MMNWKQKTSSNDVLLTKERMMRHKYSTEFTGRTISLLLRTQAQRGDIHQVRPEASLARFCVTIGIEGQE